MKTAVIVLPTYNEAGNIQQLLEEIFAQTEKIKTWDIHVLVVDSKSPDKTADIIKRLQKNNKKLHIILTEKEGLGKAYVAGFKEAIKKMNPFIIFEMDADGQHDPKKIPEFLHEIEKGADFVSGSRYLKGGGIPENWGLMRKIYSIPGNLIIRLGFMKLRLTDWTGGYRAIKTWLIKDALSHITNYPGYVFQIAFMDFAIKKNAVIKEIPIVFRERLKGESKINAKGYIGQIFFYILQNSPFIKFSFVGGLGFIIDFGISFILIEKQHWPIWLSTMLSTEMAILFNFFLNNYWSFAHKQLDRGFLSFVVNLLKFNLISSGSILIQTTGMHLLSDAFGETYWYIYKVAIIAFLIIPYSYILYNRVIWKVKK